MEMTYPEPDGGDSGRSQLAWTCGDDGVHLTNSVGKGSFMDQLKALLIRNLTLKMRDKRKTLTEFLMPLYWIMILAIIRMSIKDEHYDPIGVPHVETLVEKIQELGTGMGVVISVVYHNSEEDLLKAFRQVSSGGCWQCSSTLFLITFVFLERAKSPIISRAVVFPHHPVMNKTYLLRFNPLSILTGGLPLSSNLWTSGPNCRSLHNEDTGLQLSGCPPNHYFFSGFSVLQTLIDTAIISLQTKKNISVPSVTLENFPKEEYQSGGGLVLRSIVPLYMVFAWAQFIVYMLMLVVEEKEKKIKESMKMMGLRDSVYWLSWFAVYGAYVLVLALICIVVLPLSGVFKHVNLLLLFILFILYGCSSIVFAFMMTPFFNRAKVAGLIGNLTQVAFSLLFYLQVYLGDSINQGVFWALALLSPCAFSFAVDKVIMFDVPGGGLGFNNVWEGPGLPFAGSLIMLSVDILLYLFLAYYLDSVIPTALRSAALRCCLRCAALRCAALRCGQAALRCAELRCAALHFAVSCAALRELRCTAVKLRCTALRCATLRCTAVKLRCTAVSCAALHCSEATLRCATLRCAALRCAALQ
ncbi:ATP-binding cassette sub-family A member 5-like [Homarus americanus]|uniref:ATP-binding cassette sub-family A member 5-like n=1 Tax=Homarus americanus TaxID=6706 RepID=A0A8J5MRM7_HOMAM|nr:ATP-binding cassette sub-family A member 5-like [Homarus americanus]